jgi:hypothetical protein
VAPNKRLRVSLAIRLIHVAWRLADFKCWAHILGKHRERTIPRVRDDIRTFAPVSLKKTNINMCKCILFFNVVQFGNSRSHNFIDHHIEQLLGLRQIILGYRRIILAYRQTYIAAIFRYLI